MSSTRLEAFSDGVLAIIITIMILELKIPHSADWEVLREMLPEFFCYIISFVYIGIYWGNHHHLFHIVKHVTSGIIWSNLNLLFWLSLIPFATGWMGTNHFATNPVAVYAILLFICGLSFTILQNSIMRNHQFDAAMNEALRKANIKGYFSIAGYSSAIFFAFFYPIVSCTLFVAVAIMWIVPERNIEQALKK